MKMHLNDIVVTMLHYHTDTSPLTLNNKAKYVKIVMQIDQPHSLFFHAQK